MSTQEFCSIKYLCEIMLFLKKSQARTYIEKASIPIILSFLLMNSIISVCYFIYCESYKTSNYQLYLYVIIFYLKKISPLPCFRNPDPCHVTSTHPALLASTASNLRTSVVNVRTENSIMDGDTSGPVQEEEKQRWRRQNQAGEITARPYCCC